MLECKLVLPHLREDGADVEMNVAGVGDLKTVIDCRLAEVQIVVLDLECLLQVGESAAKFLGAPEHAGEVVIGDGAVSITLLRQAHRLVQQFKRHLEVFFL